MNNSSSTNSQSLLEEAANVATAPPRLHTLSEVAGEIKSRLQKLIAANPNTPLDLLLKLAPLHPREFLRNPVLPLLLLEKPNWFRFLSLQTSLRLLCENEVPLWLLESFATSVHRQLVRAAELHVVVAGKVGEHWHDEAEIALQQSLAAARPQSAFGVKRDGAQPIDKEIIKDERLLRTLLAVLAQSDDFKWRQGILGHPEARPIIQQLVRAGSTRDLQNYAAPDPTMTPRELETLSQGGAWAQMLAARHPNTSHEVLQKLLATNASASIVQNPHAPPEILDRLASHASVMVRQAVARHPNTSPQTLRTLSRATERETRVAVARNAQTPFDVLQQLASDANSRVRGAVARNVAAPEDLLEILSSDECGAVRLDVALHPQTPIRVLEQLATDNEGRVLHALLRHPNLPTNLNSFVQERCSHATQWNSWLPEKSVAANPKTPVEMLEKLALSPLLPTRRRVARHPNTPLNVLETLARDDDMFVRAGVAENPNATSALLEILILDADWWVRAAVAKNHNASPQLLETLTNDALSDMRYGATLVARDEALNNLICHPWASSETLRRFITQESLSSSERKKAALVLCERSDSNDLKGVTAQLLKELDIIQSGGRASKGSQTMPSKQRMVHSRERLKIVQRLLHHPRASEEFKLQMRCERLQVQQHLTEATAERQQESLTFLLQSATSFKQLAELCDPKVPHRVLEEHLFDGNWTARYVIARNPSTPLALLQQLAQDGNRFVQAAANERIKDTPQSIFNH